MHFLSAGAAQVRLSIQFITSRFSDVAAISYILLSKRWHFLVARQRTGNYFYDTLKYGKFRRNSWMIRSFIFVWQLEQIQTRADRQSQDDIVLGGREQIIISLIKLCRGASCWAIWAVIKTLRYPTNVTPVRCSSSIQQTNFSSPCNSILGAMRCPKMLWFRRSGCKNWLIMTSAMTLIKYQVYAWNQEVLH